jgi:hypothetical protein
VLLRLVLGAAMLARLRETLAEAESPSLSRSKESLIGDVENL